jgi:fructokinase
MGHVVAGLGEILWDLLPGGRQLGGAPANFAYHAKAQGADAWVVSRVGDDELGREIVARVDGLALHRDCLTVDTEHPTGTVSVELDGAGVPKYAIHENVAWDFIEATAELLNLAGGADAVCYGTLGQRGRVSRAAIRAFLGATRADCLRVFDINLRQRFFDREILDWTLRKSTVVKLNDEELPVVAATLGIETDQADKFADALRRSYGVKVVALTRGGRGSVLYAAGRWSEHAGFRVDVVDTVGAGDAFTAVLAMGLLRGEDLDAIGERANRVAAYVCTQKGAMPEMPSTMSG